MENNTVRFPSVLSDLNMNIQDDVIKKTNPLSSSNTIKNSPSSSENKKDVIGNVKDQENIKPPGVESTPSCTEGVIFKKPLPRVTMPNEDCTLNSVIDELNHLKLGATPVKSKRFNFFKWTTPLKRKAPQSDDSCASSECSAFDKNPHSPLHDEKTVEDSSSNKSDKESSSNQNDDPDAGSDYYDCGEEENTANEPVRVSEMSSDVCNTDDSSFHSISEKEHVNEPVSGNFAILKTDSKRVCEASLAEMNRAQDNDQAFILEKYLTEQDFKLEISLSEMSFNSAINNIEFDSSKRESISIQTENMISGSLFSFGLEEKSKLCLIDQQNFNDVTIQPDPFNNARTFSNENEQQTEDSLFNLITDYMVQNETQTSFDLKREENMFTLSRISEAAFLHIDTVEEEDALLQQPAARKSLQPQSSNVDSNENNATESEIKDDQVPIVPVSETTEIQTEPDIETEINEISSNMSRISISGQPTNVDQFSTNLSVADLADGAEKVTDESNSSLTETNKTISVEATRELDEIHVENSQVSPVAKLNVTVDLESTTTINKPVVEIDETPNKAADPVEKASSPSSLNVTVNTERIHRGPLCRKSTQTAYFETDESDFKQSIGLSMLNQSVDLEVSQQFSLEIEDESLYYGDSNETVDLETSQHLSFEIEDENLYENSNKTADLEENRTFNALGSSESNQSAVLEASQHFHSEIENKNSNHENANKTVNLEETRTLNEGDTSHANQTFDLEASQHFGLEIEDANSNKTVNLEETRTLNEGDTSDANQTFDLEASQHFGLEIENETVNLEETRLFGDNDALESNQAVDLDSTKTISTEVEEDKSKDVCPDPLILKQTSFSVVPELGDEKISERSLHQESFESTTLETIPAIVENLVEQCQTSNANQTVDLDIAEVIIADKLDNDELDESVYLETTSTIDEIPAEPESLASNRTIAFDLEITRVIGETSPLATHQMRDEKISERSLHQETFVESVTLETNSAIVKSLAEQCQLSIANQNIDLDIAEVVIENESDDDELGEPDDFETTSTIHQTPDESMASNRTVPFDLEITQVIGEEIAKNDESTFDQSVAFLETNQSNILESTRLVENRTDTIAESDNLNTTFDIGSSVPVEPSLEQTEAVDSEDVRTIDENTSNISDSASKSVDSELDTIKNDESEETQQPLDLSVKVTSDFTLPIADLEEQNEAVNLDNTTTVETEPCASLLEPSKLNETITMYEDATQFIPHSPEPVGSAYDTDIYMEIEEMTPCRNEIVTDICLESAEMKINVIPTPSTESIFKNSPSRFEIADDYFSSTVIRTESSFSKETQTLNISCPKQFEDTVMIQGSPCPRRSDSPCQFDVHAIPSNEPASPIPPNSPTELSNKWQTQVDLSSVADHLECITGRDSPSNSSDELDITDPVDSNLAPEMLPTGKLPPGINSSYSNLESIPEMNEVEEPSLSEKDVNQDTKDQKPLEISVENVESKPEAVSNQTTISILSEELQINDVLSSTQIPASSETESKPETCLDKSITVGAPLNTTDLIFKTPIAKLPKQSDLSALNDSSFNADYCCARTASAKASQSFRQSLISPKHSFLKGSPPIYSPFCTSNRRVRQTTPKASGDIPPSLLDLSIGYFVKCPATQVGPSELPEADVNKTIDADEEQPKHEETKLLYLDEPSRKVNVKTQTHDTELSDLRAENAKLKEDLNALMELAQATADNEVELKKTIQAIAHNEAELKETVQKLEDNNRILNNRYQLLTEYSNELLARRNKELEEAEEKIRALQIKLNEFSKKSKTEASSK